MNTSLLEDFTKANLIHYRHTQVGHVVLAALALGLVFITVLMALTAFSWAAFAGLCVLAISLVFFGFLTVIIRGDILEIRFGPGIIRKKFYLKEIHSCRVVKNRWYYGWGIRMTPHGWLFNVSGLSAVEIKLKNGRTYRIGTDVPEGLQQAIQKNLT